LINFFYAIIVLLIVLKTNIALLQTFFLTFLVMLIPFFIVNGILTGSFIENEVVWYNNSENLGIRLFTIPIEDTIYALSLILTNLALTEYFQSKLVRTK
jgi:lycopene cyclase domain-containing protein